MTYSRIIPLKPYIIKALYKWIAIDNNCTPWIVVDAGHPGVNVPRNYVVDNLITLDLSPKAVQDLTINDEAISVKTKFEGTSHSLYIPTGSVIVMFPEENASAVIRFPKGDYIDNQAKYSKLPKHLLQTQNRTLKKQPKFRIIKGGKD